MRKIIFTRPDGGVSVVTPVINTFGEEEGFTETQAEQRAWDKLPTDAINPRWCAANEVTADRTFRDAWGDIGKVSVNMPKAREIQKNALRTLRTPKLAALDVEYSRADEKGDATLKASIAAKKQLLRDVTADPRIAAAQTPEELKAVIPEVLK